MIRMITAFSVILILSCSNIIPSKEKPSAVNGVIDLRGWDFPADGPAYLLGDWKFVWLEDNPAFSDPHYDDSSWLNLAARNYWSKVTGSGTGYGWYRIRIKLNGSELRKYGQLGIYIEFFKSSYEMFVNGRLAATAGKFGRTKEESVPQLIPRLVMVDVPPGTEDIVIAVRCSNFHHRGGGLYHLPELGIYNNIKQRLWRADYIKILASGIMLMMGIYHLFLWIGRREDRASLYFTCGCFILFLRLMATYGYFELLFPEADLFEFKYKIIYMSIPAGSVSFILFFQELFPEGFSIKLLTLFKIICAVLIAFALAAPCILYSHISFIYEGMLLFAGIWMFAVTIIAAFRKREWAGYMMPGCFLLFITGLNDILSVKLIINSPELAPAGLTGLIFFQAAVLSKRFAVAFRTAEHLSSYLQEEVEIKTRDLSERTREAEEARGEIEKANTRLMEMDNYKSLFFQNITHEFRTPLTLIIGYIEKAIDSASLNNPEIMKAQYRIILSNARRLLKLINQLLDISKIDARMMLLKEEPADIVKLIRTVASYFESPASDRKIDFSVSFGAERITGLIDVEKLEKILYNMLSNAFKFTGENGRITVHAAEINDQAVITVSDTGIGIEEAKLPRIFERFYQGEGSSIRNHEGTGIGLSLVKEYVDLFMGSIDVQSTEGKGSVFTVTLPLKKADGPGSENELTGFNICSSSAALYTADIAGSGRAADKSADNGISAGGKPVILLVEDNPDVRTFAAEILQERFAVIEAENGVDALLRLSERIPDLIISDIMMPKMDGYQFLNELKQNHAASRVPVILLTAKVGENEKILGLEYGADDYILKPFSARELVTRADYLIRLYRYQRVLAQRNHEIENDLEIARAIQSKLIMIDHAGHGDNFYALYRPFDKVAGDFYSYSENEETVNIFIADVSGHGVASAFLSLVAKNELDILLKNRTAASDVMLELNSIISRYTVKDNFITAFYCIFEKKTGRLAFSRAGHNPPLLVRRESGDVTELKSAGSLLGVFSELKIEEKEIYLKSGDRIVFYTDGIIETCSVSREMYGLNRLIECVKTNRTLQPKEFSEKLLSEVTGFLGPDQFDDDVTLLIFDVP